MKASKNSRSFGISAKYPYPSFYGSHAMMVNENKTQALKSEFSDMVVLTDVYGDYLTNRSSLDSGLRDLNRSSGFVINKGSTNISSENYSERQLRVDGAVDESKLINENETAS